MSQKAPIHPIRSWFQALIVHARLGLFAGLWLASAAAMAETLPIKPPGAGTSQDPMRIENLAHLRWLSETTNEADLAKSYVIVNDIDASESKNWGDPIRGFGFSPIGGMKAPYKAFRGSLRGNNKIISNLHITPSLSGWVGFIREVGPGGYVSGLYLDNLYIEASNLVGGLAYENKGTIRGVGVDATIRVISNNASEIGGLVGRNLGKIRWSHANVDIGPGPNVGTANHDMVGGLIGVNGLPNGSILGAEVMHTYSTGIIRGKESVGGLIGEARSGLISRSFTAVEIQPSPGHVPSTVGGVVGFVGINEPMVFNEIYWSPDFAGLSRAGTANLSSADVTSLSKSQMLGSNAPSGMPGLDFGRDWSTSVGGHDQCTVGVPQLINLRRIPAAYVESTTSGGTGSLDDPCLISNWHDLDKIRQHRRANFALSNDLDTSVSGFAAVAGGTEGFVPIGTQSFPFTGSLNGRGHYIDGLPVTQPILSGIGLFTHLGPGANVTNINFTNAQIEGLSKLGVLAGSVDSTASISQVRVGGSVTSTESGISQQAITGGLVGENRGTLTDVSSSVQVEGSADAIGGLIGLNFGSVSGASATGSAKGRGQVGGLIGLSQSGRIIQSFSSADVTATGANFNNPSNASGIAGGLIGASFFGERVSEALASGTVEGDLAGGLVGVMFQGPIYQDVYGTSTLKGNPSSAGGLVGAIDNGTLRRAYFIGTDNTNSGLNGLVASATSETWTDVFYDSEALSLDISDSGIGQPKTTEEMIKPATFGNWDLNAIWGLGGNAALSYPFLRALTAIEPTEVSLELINTTPSDGATGITLASDELVLTFNVDATFNAGLGDLEILRNGEYVGGSVTMSRRTLKSWALGFDFKPGSTYKITLPQGAFRAMANDNVVLKSAETITFTTIPFANGDGTQASPYEISSRQDWINFTQNDQVWDAHLVLTQNIAFPTNEDSIIKLSPVGAFSGTLDGQGHFISNAVVEDTTSVDVGLFKSITSTGTVKNLHLVNATVTGTQTTGLMAGLNVGTLDGVSAEGSVTSTGDQVGGLVGVNRGVIKRSFASAEITGANVLGGLVGTHKTNAGDTAALIQNAYANSTLVGRSDLTVAGGLIGRIEGAGNTVDNTYSISSIAPTPNTTTTIGGLIGEIGPSASINVSSSYWLDSWAGGSGVAGTSKTEAQLKDEAIFTDWDFRGENIGFWQIVNGTDIDGSTPIESYPYLQGLPYDAIEGATIRMPIPGLGEKKYADGTGTSGDPFIIQNWRHLNNIRNETAATPHFRLDADLDKNTVGYSDYASAEANTNTGWLPIPSISELTFDGNGKSIRDLVIERPTTSSVGLFAEISSQSTLSDLVVHAIKVSGQSEVGILAGINEGTITRSASMGMVESNDTVDDNAGGLVGENIGQITKSYSNADVIGQGDGFNIGGLVGLNRGDIEDAYATGAIDGAGSLGGLVGQNGTTLGDSASITRSYATGKIINSAGLTDGVAGLVGIERTDAGVDESVDIAPDSFWDVDTTGQTDPGDSPPFPSPGVGKTTTQMKTIATYTTDLGGSAWDFTTVWDIVNVSIGDDTIVSYPFLRNNEQSPNPGNTFLDDFDPNNSGSGTESDPYRITAWRHLANIARYPNAVFSLEKDLVADDADPDFTEFASSNANGGLGWTPIMGESAAFTGTLKGNGHSITGFVINQPLTDNVGLFAQLGNGARIENLTLEGVVTGRSNVGVVAGLSAQATLENVTVSASTVYAGFVTTLDNVDNEDPDAIESSNAGGLVGQVTNDGQLMGVEAQGVTIIAEGARVGGLVGYLKEGDISQSQAQAQLSAPAGVGGLVGRASTRSGAPETLIDQSFAKASFVIESCPAPGANVEFENEEGFGGLVGTAGSSGAIINKSYAEISMTLTSGCENIGGLVGFTYSGLIQDSYVLGSIQTGDSAKHVGTLVGEHANQPRIISSYGAVSINTGTSSQHIGGLIGSALGFPATVNSAPSIIESFYNQQLPGNANDDCDTNGTIYLCGEGKTTLQLKEVATFANWPLGGSFPTWQMASGDFVSYPYLVSPAQDPAPGLEGAPMELVFDTTLGDGTTISLPLDGTVDVRINWGDGNEQAITSPGFAEHTYASEGTYTVKIFGDLSQYGRRGGNSIAFPNTEKLTTVGSFGNIGIQSLAFAFKEAINLSDVPSTAPTGLQQLSGTFEGATSFNDDISNWDVSQVLRMNHLFAGATQFNQPIGGWNTSQVRSFYRTFARAESFNQPLNDWDVSSAESFNRMFVNATSFNQDLNDWQLDSINNTAFMFSGASAFNGNISNWSTSTVDNMRNMFASATSFNQPIGDWDVQAVGNFRSMFDGATAFNQPLNTWQPVQGENFQAMFREASSFNQPLNNWNVSNATNMRDMFYGATSFNQALANWDFSSVTDLTDVLLDSAMTTVHYDALLESLSSQTLQPNVTLGAGDVRYNEGAPATAREDLINNDGWTIDDGGLIPTFSGGTGAITAPHKISSLADLRTLSEDPNSWNLNFELTQSLDAFDTANWNSGEGFSPIGSSIAPFTGHFDGKGHSITGLTINRSNQSQIGLFGHVSGMVDSLSLIDADIVGESEVGGVAGFNDGLILDVAVTGSVEGSVAVAGVVGNNGPLGHLSTAVSHANVTGSNQIGGVIGQNQGVLQDAYAIGTLTSNRTVGGLVGAFTDSRSIIDRGYSATTMTTSGQGQQPGGIAGSVGIMDANAAGGEVRNSYFVGDFDPEGAQLLSFGNFSIDTDNTTQTNLRSRTSAIGTDPDWAINGTDSEWAMLSVDQIQANGKFYRAYPYLRIFNYDEPGTTPAALPLPGLIEMPMPPVIDRDNTSVSGDTLTLVFSVPQDSPDASVSGIEYSLDNGETWQAASQASSPLSVTGLASDRAYVIRVRTQTDQGLGPMSNPYRVLTGGRIFKDSFEKAPTP